MRALPAARLRRAAPLAQLALLLASGCAKSDARLVAELADRDPYVRALAAFALAEQAPELSTQALPVLLETVDQVELDLGVPTLVVLSAIAPRVHAELLAAYVGPELLTEDRRRAIAVALGAAGPAAVTPVIDAVRGAGRSRAGELAPVLVAIGEPTVAPLTVLLAEDPDPWLRGWAAWTLGALGPRARGALPALRAAERDPHEAVVRLAREAQASIGAGERGLPPGREEAPRGPAGR